MATSKRNNATRKPRTDNMPAPRVVAIGAAFLLTLAGLGYLATQVYNGVPGKQYETLFVETPRVGNLLSHDGVRIDGARVGQVVGRDVENGQPRIELQLDPGTKIPEGTKASFRANGLLGARYVDLTVGDGEGFVPDGGTIKGGEEQYTSGVPEALGTFDEETRGRLGDALGGLGQGLLGRGEGLNETIFQASDQALNFREFADTVLRREGSAERLLPALRAAVTPLDRNRFELAELSGELAKAVTPFVTEREATRDTLSAGGPALRAVVPGLGKGTTLVDVVDDLAVQLNRTLPGAPRGLTGLRDLLRDGREPLEQARPLVGDLEDVTPALIDAVDSLRPVLGIGRRTLANLSPTLQHISDYECDLRNFGVVMRSMTGYTQPGIPGPAGPPQGFRALPYTPASGAGLYLEDNLGIETREGVTPPCTYLSKPYPQFVPGGRR